MKIPFESKHYTYTINGDPVEIVASDYNIIENLDYLQLRYIGLQVPSDLYFLLTTPTERIILKNPAFHVTPDGNYHFKCSNVTRTPIP